MSDVRHGGEPADPTSDVPRPDASFAAQVTVADDAVRVTWTLTNRTEAELLVADRLPDDTGELDQTGVAYLTGDPAQKGRVVVSQRVFPQPQGSTVDFAQAPEVGATRVAAGATVRGQVVVPRPWQRRYPYGNDLGFGTIALPDPATDVRFCLGVLPSPYPAQVTAQGDVEHPVVDHGLGNARTQYLFCSEPVPLPRESSASPEGGA